MRLLYIYDTDELQRIGSINKAIPFSDQIHILTVNNGKPRRLYDIATDIKKTILSNESVIFINQYLKCSGTGFEWLQNSAGVALVKLLRILGVSSHIVFISPFSKIQLIEINPGHLILSSPGISFVKYLFEFTNKTEEELKQYSERKFCDQEKLKQYILADFRLPEDERHNWANWWGIYRLWEIQKYFDETYRNLLDGLDSMVFTKYLENKVPSVFKELTDLNGQKAKYLYGFQTEELENSLLSEDILVLKDQMKKLEDRILMQNNLTRYLNGEGKQNAENKLAQLRIEQSELTNKLQNIETQLIEGNFEQLIEQSEIRSLQETIKRQLSSLRILHIDDNASKGWSDIFQNIIYGGRQDTLIFKSCWHTNKSVELLYSEVKDEIDSINPNLLLLDLRLQNEGGTQLGVGDISGFRILQRIRQDFPGLPVMMTTASNKIWSYKALIDAGADYYWIKEGIEVSASLSTFERVKFSVGNYWKFLKAVNILCSDEYQFMNRIGKKIRALTNKRDSFNWWWSDVSFASHLEGDERRCTRDYFSISKNFETVFDILIEALNKYRELLQIQLERENSTNPLFEKSIGMSQIINLLSGIIEMIHFGDQQVGSNRLIGAQWDKRAKAIIPKREDYAGAFLMSFRNNASHFVSMKQCTFKHFSSFLAGLLTYIDEGYNQFALSDTCYRDENSFRRTTTKEWWISEDDDKDIVTFFEELINMSPTFSKSYYDLKIGGEHSLVKTVSN